MPAAPETLKALEEARAVAERLFHTYAGAYSQAASKAARDLFGRLAAWEMHHFEEIERAALAQGEAGVWVDYSPVDFEKSEPKAPEGKEGRGGGPAFSEAEALAAALENERASYTMYLGLAAKAKHAKERDWWTAFAAEEDLHVKVLKEQADALRVGGTLTWKEGGGGKSWPKASYSAARAAVAMISPLSTSELPTRKGSMTEGSAQEGETELLPPGWEKLAPSATKKFQEVAWQPPPISDPKTPVPGTVAPPTAPSPGGGWVPVSPPPAAAPNSGGWIPMGAEVAPPPPPPEEKKPKTHKPPSTVRHVGKPVRDSAPGRPPGLTDTAIMDRPLAGTGGRWVYEASVKTAAQLTAPNPPPADGDCLALISGSARRAFLDILNRRGAQGWELLQLGFHKDTVVFFWKRRE